MAEAGTQNDGDVGPEAPQGLGQGFASHLRHGLIGDDEIKTLRRGPKGFQRFYTAQADNDLIVQAFQVLLPGASHHGLVIDQQHAPPAPWERLGRDGFVIVTENGLRPLACRIEGLKVGVKLE